MSSAVTRFEDMSLSEPLLQALRDVGYETPSQIQAASIPVLLAGGDLVGQAQTGTGKTAAFALPLLEKLDLKQNQPQVLVLTPTRELAIQVSEAFQSYAHHLKGFHVLPVYGGQGMDLQLRQLKRGVHVIVGTPGRVMDHLRRKTLSLQSLRTLVLDEADEMLRMGFIDDVQWILEHTPQERQIALFSATMPDEIRKVAKQHLRTPTEIKIQSNTTTVEAINQLYWQVSGTNKLDALTRILEAEEMDAALIFVRTKTATLQLAEKLEARGYACAALNGDINQAQRERTIEQLKNERLDIVVATDVAARGLDVSRISHVINYDIPTDVESYVHRIGRTGRAGRKGTAILFVAPREMRLLRAIEKATRQPVRQIQLPSLQTITDKRIEQFRQQLLKTIADQNLDFFQNMIAEFQLSEELPPEKIAAALAYLVQEEKPLQSFHVASSDIAESSDRSSRHRDKPRDSSKKEFRNDDRKEYKTRERPSGERSGEPRKPGPGMTRYRIEVGRNHGVMPKDIVGAIANEAGVAYDNIGYIKLEADYSTVDLPEGMPKEIFQHLKKLRVRQHPLNISVDSGDARPAPKKVFPDAFEQTPERHSGFAPSEGERPRIKPGEKRRAKPAFDKKPGGFKAKPDFKSKSDFKPKTGFKPKSDDAPKPDRAKKPDFPGKPRDEHKRDKPKKKFIKPGSFPKAAAPAPRKKLKPSKPRPKD